MIYNDPLIEFKPNTFINIPIYQPKYKIGDVVYLQNEHNKLGIYLKILSYELLFSEFASYSGTIQTPQIISSTYSCQIMPGSYSNIAKICTNGILVGYITMNILLVDKYTSFVGHTTNDYVLYNSKTLVSEINKIEDSERTNTAILLNLTKEIK